MSTQTNTTKPLFNAAQTILLKTYCQGEFSSLLDLTSEIELKSALDKAGDTLLVFLVLELADSEDCLDLVTAHQRLDTAVESINEVIEQIIQAS